MRNSFVFYGSWWEAIKNLPRDIQGDVLTAIIEYGLTGVTTGQLKPIAKAMLAMAKSQIDINNQRFENGRKGGRKKPNLNQTETKVEPNLNQTETKVEPNVNDNVNENDSFPVETEKEIPPNGGTKKKTKSKHRYAPLVLLTDDEYSRLVAQYGESGVQWMIKKLDDYKAARGMTYKSDYRAILNWVVKEYEKRNYGRNTEIRRNTADIEKQFRDEEFAEHIAKKLTGD